MKAVVQRVIAEWRLKLFMLAVLPAGFLLGYFLLQNFLLFPPRTVPELFADRWIAFNAHWTLPYESLYLLLVLAPALATRRIELRIYARGMIAMSAVAFVIFLIAPVASPDPQSPTGHWPYDFLVTIDQQYNSIPSLHAGFTIYSVLFARRVLRDEVPRSVLVLVTLIGTLWAGIILYSILAIERHWAIDLPPGLLLGWLAHVWTWRCARTRDAFMRSRANVKHL